MQILRFVHCRAVGALACLHCYTELAPGHAAPTSLRPPHHHHSQEQPQDAAARAAPLQQQRAGPSAEDGCDPDAAADPRRREQPQLRRHPRCHRNGAGDERSRRLQPVHAGPLGRQLLAAVGADHLGPEAALVTGGASPVALLARGIKMILTRCLTDRRLAERWMLSLILKLCLCIVKLDSRLVCFVKGQRESEQAQLRCVGRFPGGAVSAQAVVRRSAAQHINNRTVACIVQSHAHLIYNLSNDLPRTKRTRSSPLAPLTSPALCTKTAPWHAHDISSTISIYTPAFQL